MDPSINKRAQINMDTSESVSAKVANGEKLTYEGTCVAMKFTVQGFSLCTDLLELMLVGCDVVLMVE